MEEEGEEMPWDALPEGLLINIFCRTTIRDRIGSLSLVCRLWQQASQDPLYWESMIAVDSDEYDSTDNAFVKESNEPNSCHDFFVNPFDIDDCLDNLGVLRLRTLIQRSIAGKRGRAKLNSIYLSPFLATSGVGGGPRNDDEILYLIADCCPNLKHLSFDGSYNASEDAVLNIIRSCKRLQLIDFSDSSYVTEEVLEELGGNNCPCFRGIRRSGTISSFQASAIAINLPRLRLLNLSNTDLTDGGLSTILSGCLCLEYLDVRGCNFLRLGFHMIERATAQIIEFLYDPDEGYYDDSGDWFEFDRSDSIYW